MPLRSPSSTLTLTILFGYSILSRMLLVISGTDVISCHDAKLFIIFS